ncbi:MAG: HPr kinase/phosphorylase, partial [Rhizobiaceae bacterium]|nr:HPr kinase/phosphorylase [Rhizobiaceae bacterium]
DTGLLFLGPSGSGKSSVAFACLADARPLGQTASLVADDQVFIVMRDGKVIAECPPSIAGLMEIRYTGIIRIPHVAAAEMHYAIQPVDPATAERLPPEDEWINVTDNVRLPLIRLSAIAANPLAIIMAKIGITLR